MFAWINRATVHGFPASSIETHSAVVFFEENFGLWDVWGPNFRSGFQHPRDICNLLSGKHIRQRCTVNTHMCNGHSPVAGGATAVS